VLSQSAQSLAVPTDTKQFSPLHMLKVLLDDSEACRRSDRQRAGGIPRHSLKPPRMPLNKLPKVSGSGAGQVYLPRSGARFRCFRKRRRKGGDRLCHGRAACWLGLTLEKAARAGTILSKGGVHAAKPQTRQSNRCVKGRPRTALRPKTVLSAEEYSRTSPRPRRRQTRPRDRARRGNPPHHPVLSRRNQNNPVLDRASPEVGKTANRRGLACGSSTATCRRS